MKANLLQRIFGADVFHPDREEKGRPSVAAVCASQNTSPDTVWIRDYWKLEGMIVELLRQFQNNLLPYQILFNRQMSM